MKNFVIYFFVSGLLRISESKVESSEAKTYIFHTFARFHSSNQKLENFFSETSDKKLFTIRGNLDDDQTVDLKMNVNLSSYHSIQHQKVVGSKHSVCSQNITSKDFVFFLKIADSESKILLFGCEVGSMDFIRVAFYESSDNILSETRERNLFYASDIHYFNRSTLKFKSNIGCACNELQEAQELIESEALKEKNNYLVFAYVIGIFIAIVVIKTVSDRLLVSNGRVHPLVQ